MYNGLIKTDELCTLKAILKTSKLTKIGTELQYAPEPVTNMKLLVREGTTYVCKIMKYRENGPPIY